MTTYAVGDIQGCLEPLRKLLDIVGFEAGVDQLWSVGDIVNRGPQSLETLRFCKNLGDSFRMVLGNHDLHLLAIAHGVRAPTPKDTLDQVLNAGDCDSLLSWLQRQPLLIRSLGFTLVHAGIPPHWSLQEAAERAAEVETVLAGSDAQLFFENMYGNEPAGWDADLQGPDRWRTITNYFTRMRFCDSNGRLELTTKLGPDNPPPGYAPWFSHPNRKTALDNILFGHWASLEGRAPGDHLFPLDTGCVWGGKLRMMRLEDRTLFHYPSR